MRSGLAQIYSSITHKSLVYQASWSPIVRPAGPECGEAGAPDLSVVSIIMYICAPAKEPQYAVTHDNPQPVRTSVLSADG